MIKENFNTIQYLVDSGSSEMLSDQWGHQLLRMMLLVIKKYYFQLTIKTTLYEKYFKAYIIFQIVDILIGLNLHVY